MKELELKYGCNPNQKPARIYMEDGSELPVRVLCGRPGYINFSGCLQCVAAGKGAESGAGTARRHFLQARQPHLGCGRNPAA